MLACTQLSFRLVSPTTNTAELIRPMVTSIANRRYFDHDGIFVKRSFARRSILCSATMCFLENNDLPDQEKSVSITANDRIEVKLNNVVVECRCGVHPWEKHPERPNRLSISITLFAGLNSRRIAEFGYIYYDQIK